MLSSGVPLRARSLAIRLTASNFTGRESRYRCALLAHIKPVNATPGPPLPILKQVLKTPGGNFEQCAIPRRKCTFFDIGRPYRRLRRRATATPQTANAVRRSVPGSGIGFPTTSVIRLIRKSFLAMYATVPGSLVETS